MRFLLDTHVFLWWISDALQLSQKVRKIIEKGRNEFFWSAASSWEVSIKYKLGKLPLPDVPEVFIPEQLHQNRITSLDIRNEHAFRAGQLPFHHRDPFDRMLIAQAQIDKLPIITTDENMNLYDVTIIW